jgi:hypothetical protein
MSQVANLNNRQYALSRLTEMRGHGGAEITRGLTDEIILDFLQDRADLATAIDRGYGAFLALKESHADFLALDESEQILRSQKGLTNFYPADGVNPYVAVAAAGPWIVTLKGAVVYDCGGYGMLGLGHAPSAVLDAMNKRHAMANVMTPSVSQLNFIERLQQEIGARFQNRRHQHPNTDGSRRPSRRAPNTRADTSWQFSWSYQSTGTSFGFDSRELRKTSRNISGE